MDHDIRTRLRDAAAAPTHTPDFDTLADRARRRHLVTRAATAMVATVGVIVAGVLVWPSAPASSPYIGDDPSTPTSPPARAPGPAMVDLTLTFPRPVADHPDPVERAGAAGTKVDCDGPVHLGGWALDAGGPAAGTAAPRAALQAFLDQGLLDLPHDGYHQVAAEPGRVLFTYQVDGRAKVAVIVADGTVVAEPVNAPDGWGFEVFATCDPAEYAPSATTFQTVWTDRDGNRVPTTTITSFPGPAHCDWESVTFLHLNDRQYLRDPRHLLTDRTVERYAASTELPPDATDTGYRNDNHELWLSADRFIAYLVTAVTIEAWPATTDPVACM